MHRQRSTATPKQRNGTGQVWNREESVILGVSEGWRGEMYWRWSSHSFNINDGHVLAVVITSILLIINEGY